MTETDIIESREILRRAIFKILEINLSKKDLLKELDLKGYSNKV